jgi:uncharacterized protein
MIIEDSYKPPLFLLKNGNIQTLAHTLFRKIKGIKYQRERIFTVDNDVIDLDWSKVGGKSLIIISDGLEAQSTSDNVLGMEPLAKII